VISVVKSSSGFTNAMDLGAWLGLLAGVGGATVAIYGAAILLTNRAIPSDRRAFRRVKDAGLYYLCFGLALTLIVLSVLWNEHHQSLLAVAAIIGAMCSAGLAVIKYRSRRKERP
jgi:membrane associated rhomboid family serine protease